jgi:heme-degrading monooxygenase HmoA
MFTRLTLLEIDTVRTDMESAVELFRTEVLPELHQQPGYAGVLVMATPEGAGAIVSFWETPEAADAAGSTGFYADVLARYATIFKSPPGRERYQVALAELPSTAPI